MPAELPLRQRILWERRKQDPSERRSKSELVTRKWIAGLPKSLVWASQQVALYRPLGDELDLSGVGSFLRAEGARIFYPKIVSEKDRRLEMVGIRPGTVWVKGVHSIMEPANGKVLSDPSLLDWIFVPGVAFGAAGERIGMGHGYYDRYLERASRALRVSLAFDFQYCEKLSQNPWDQKVDWVLTEAREVRTESGIRKLAQFQKMTRK